MDFNFGELNEPFSRAFFEEYEDFSVNTEFKRPTWDFVNEDYKKKVSNSTNFLLVEGNNAHSIMENSLLKGANLIAQMKKHNIKVYHNDQFFIGIIEDNKTDNFAASIAKLLSPWFESAKMCIILSLQSTAEYKNDNAFQNCVIRSVGNNGQNIPTLEVPNFLTGCAAGICTLRKFNELQCSCFIAYIDLHDVISLNSIMSLLKTFNISVTGNITLPTNIHKNQFYL
ncbi:CLUMA_CG011489, isoform A [Clunio marinus]|uniref:Proteasome assembly chaperone 1 n=1 Tax=Clunio marinus TaxID=568069 RepID=A0A1J1II43_9DIPT|nr:CLUMA_CG011489, isoform A [Clunio marinus]